LHTAAAGRVNRNMPDPVPAALMGRLAIDRSWQRGLAGRGLGSALLRDAVLRVVGAAGTIGVRALLVHAISDEAKRFYEHRGFRASAIEPMTLMITIEEARKILVEPRRK
jgi:ribosomal protein S18 acetylase RimI-like enzyme